jgi:hypothetical protein
MLRRRRARLRANPDFVQLLREGRFENIRPYTGAALETLT